MANGGSPLNKTDLDFNGMGKTAGINPANGVVLYYQLPEIKAGEVLTLEVKDASGNMVRTFSSKKDSLFSEWEGGPSAEPTLSAKKGLNRFVWDVRYPTMSGVPGTYFENSFAGHKAAPGKYSFHLKWAAQTVSTTAEILPNPLYPTTPAAYAEYHRIMSDMEGKVTEMHNLINRLAAKREQLDQLLGNLPKDKKYKSARETGETLSKKMKTWDEDMVQRKSKAYDDVENFPNKLSANYMFLLNQTESDVPQVNQPSLDLKKQLDAEWATLKKRADEFLEKDLPNLNKLLWEAGVGGIWIMGN